MKRPILSRLYAYVTATRERMAIAVELAGAALIVYALGVVSLPLAIGAVGVVIVVFANLYMGGDDGTTDDGDSEGS